MSQVLPQQAGLLVNDVIYTYSTVKNTDDAMLVHVQNENAQGEGYIFRETDDWSGLPSNRINKLVATGGIPIEYWGNGSIEVEGKGEVKNASIIYSYSFDPCFDPQTLPTCPGYIDYDALLAAGEDFKDPLDDTYVQEELKRKADLDDKEEQDRQRKKMEANSKRDRRLELALGAVNVALMEADATAKEAELMAMAQLPTTYLNTTIAGGTYNDVPLPYEDKQLPQNTAGRRMGFAQQKLHDEMVQSQYGESK